MSAIEFTLLFFGCMFLFLGLGVPISIALGGLSGVLVYFFWGPGAISMLVLKSFGMTSSFEFIAVPLFVFMANMLERSGIAEDLYETMNRFVGGRPGGLAAGTVIICTIFAAMAGISGAATVSMGILALPAMMARGYSTRLALGSVAAGGSLGILIPPSVTMIIYGVVSQTSVGKLYAGGVLPGLLLSALFITYILVRAHFQPHIAPPRPDTERYTWPQRLSSLTGLVFPIALVIGVLGSIITGLTSVSEAAAIGAFGSLVAAAMKRRIRWPVLQQSAEKTLLVSCLIFWIVIGASAFATLYTAMGAANLIRDAVIGLEVSRYVILVVIMLMLIVMGMVIDTVGIIMIAVPVFVPIVTSLGFDPVWFGVLFIINMEIGFLTPPFGYNLFYLKGVAPKGVKLTDIYRSITPFVLLMMLGLAICIAVPEIILYLPGLIF